MELTEAIRIARKTLAEHFDLYHILDAPSVGRRIGSGPGGQEAADAYNVLAAFHPKAEKIRS